MRRSRTTKNLDLTEPANRTILNAGDDLGTQERLVIIGVAQASVTMPDAADQEVSKTVS